MRRFISAAAVGLCLFSASAFAANVLVGSGPDTSYFVLESPNLGVQIYEIRYTYSASVAQDGYTLLSSVLGATPSVTVSLTNSGTAAQPNLDRKSVV